MPQPHANGSIGRMTDDNGDGHYMSERETKGENDEVLFMLLCRYGDIYQCNH